ncbi:MAG: transcriptional regulator [Oceanospirillum sp.]|nr:transcriptional regulator [Oceanospirillum sp.]
MTKLKRITPAADAGEPTPINPERVLAGAPKEVLENLFTNEKENFFCGVWSSTEGKWMLNYTEDEFCYLIKGKAILTDAEGVTEEINAGDAFVVPAGYQGTWETIGEAQKFYAIYEEV